MLTLFKVAFAPGGLERFYGPLADSRACASPI